MEPEVHIIEKYFQVVLGCLTNGLSFYVPIPKWVRGLSCSKPDARAIVQISPKPIVPSDCGCSFNSRRHDQQINDHSYGEISENKARVLCYESLLP
jgi:hypothetical protein